MVQPGRPAACPRDHRPPSPPAPRRAAPWFREPGIDARSIGSWPHPPGARRLAVIPLSGAYPVVPVVPGDRPGEPANRPEITGAVPCDYSDGINRDITGHPARCGLLSGAAPLEEDWR